MTSLEIDTVVSLANRIGRPLRLLCKYEQDRARRVFAFRFYRHGIFIGSTTDPKKVIHKMGKFACATS